MIKRSMQDTPVFTGKEWGGEKPAVSLLKCSRSMVMGD